MDILPVLEAEFDNLAMEEIDFRIDKLEIDLGYLTEEMIESGKWSLLFKEKLIEQLQLLLENELDKSDITRAESFRNIFHQWYYFIRHGYLPWNALPPSDLWFENVLKAIATDYEAAERIRKLIVSNPGIAQRIVFNHNEEFLTHLVELLTAENQSQLPAMMRELLDWTFEVKIQLEPIGSATKKEALTRIWTILLPLAALEISGQSAPTLIKSLITQSFSGSSSIYSSLKNKAPSQKKYPLMGAVIRSIIKDDLEISRQEDGLTGSRDIPIIEKSESGSRHETDNRNNAEPLPEIKDVTSPAIAETSESVSDQLSRKSDGEGIERIRKNIDLEEGIYIHLAGLVLLHPFLHSFFRKLELVKEGVFIDKGKQERAICLLHELADSNMERHEYDLVLPKLLCGWPLHQVVNTGIELNIEERHEATHLLQAVIEQWEILKKTSILALQQTFLQREGKLRFKNENWWLQVEKKSMDVLLDHLPWTIGMIKLPWMKELLRVEWR